ncbi:hypothetical protein L9F63_014236, partial [Diploptera punctata]
RMLIEGYNPAVPSLPPPPALHHPQQPPPPYYYANYVQQQQQQHPTTSVEDLFSLWLGSSSAVLSTLDVLLYETPPFRDKF